MTATETVTQPTDQFDILKTRYPKVREPIVMALHILMQNPDIALDDAKAQAALRGVRITAASVSAAQRLLSRRDGAGEPAAPAPKSPASPPTRVRRPRAQAKELDAEALIRGVLGKIQEQGNADAERLREAIRKAIAVLQAAVG